MMFQLVVLSAIPFIWFGMVGAISFPETPLKFRAHGMTVALGEGIGKIVFKILNRIEAVFAIGPQVLVLRPSMAKRTAVAALDPDPAATQTSFAAAVITLAAPAPVAKKATGAHLSYVATELIKFVALPIAGITVFPAAL
ncbi:hypothetical protein [Arthrobacter terrae]|nr:hypothetical protein [Arthrobacter terrae]